MWRAAALFVALSLASAAKLETEEHPVMKVVRMLQDMKGQLQQEVEDDKDVFEKLTCWCGANKKEKEMAVEAATATIAQLEASLGEAAAQIEELKTKRADAQAEVDKNHASLGEAKALRMKENKEFHAEETDLLAAVAACKNAVTVLSKHHPEFAQLRSVADSLQAARVLSLMSIDNIRAQAIKSFMTEARSGTSFLAVPGFQSYAPQSGQVFGILRQMQEDFEGHLSESQAAEEKAGQEFNALTSSKEAELDAGKKLVVQLDTDIAALKEKHAQQFKELDDTKAQLEIDQEFLVKLEKMCSTSDADYESRMRSRLEEISAVDDAIKILNNDQAFNVFDDSLVTNFLQLSAHASEETQMRQKRAFSVLARAARDTGAPWLAAIASKVRLDTFVRVKADIEKMIAELQKQQQDEIEHRDWCIEETNTNKRKTDAAYDKRDGLEAKVAELEKTIGTLGDDIKATKELLADLQQQMKSASENREAENADYQQTITDQRLTQMILNKALTRMRQVYDFLQGAPHIHTSGDGKSDPGNGPAKFTKYEKNKGGSRVVVMIETVIADSKKTEDEAITAEHDAQTNYEIFMKESNKAVVAGTKKITNMSESLAKTKQDHGLTKTDFKTTMEDLENLNEELGDLKKNCDFVINNFDARQSSRAAEVDALKEAKAILSGMK